VKPSRWVRRLVGGVVAFVALYVALALARTDPDAVRLALLVAICVGVLGLVLDALSDGSPSWEVPVERPTGRDTGDPRLGRYVNLLEAHLSARSLDATLRDRLGVLADQVLRQRYGVSRDDPRAVELLGPELVAVLTGPARRLGPPEIDRCLTRIEEL
jgi:hypothetical protein